MIYREYLVIRKALAWFAGIVLAFMLVVPAAWEGNSLEYAVIANGSAWIAAIFASIFGVALGNGSREAARVLWVLPVPRWQLALQVIAVDLAGTTAAFACVYAFILIVAGLRFHVGLHGTFSATDIAMALAMVYATYRWSALVGMLGAHGVLRHHRAPGADDLDDFRAIADPSGDDTTATTIANPFVVYNVGLHCMPSLQSLTAMARHRLDNTTSYSRSRL